MKKKFYAIIVLAAIFISNVSFANIGLTDSLSFYKDNYFVNGMQEESQTKAQLSLKYRLFNFQESSIFVGYTNTLWWMTDEKSYPIKEHSYNPEIFHRINSLNSKFLFLDYFQYGISHNSNGLDGPDSRSLNYNYIQLQVSSGRDINIGTNLMFWDYFTISKKNIDIEKYSGNGEYEFFIKLNAKKGFFKDEKLSLKLQFGNNESFELGKQVLSFEFRFNTKFFNPLFYFIYENGYGVNGLVDYNKKSSVYKFGLSIK